MVPFFQKQGIIKKNEFPLKHDDVIVMSSNVHEWKGKLRSNCMISMFDATDQSFKTKLHPIIVRQ